MPSEHPVVTSLSPGVRIGAYEVVKRIGVGGMGEVFLARDVRLKREVALKVLPDRYRFDEARLARFEREAQLLASLNHPNIATLHGFETSDTRQAFVMELVEGETLAERVDGGSLPLASVLAISLQLVDALDAAHERGIVHRDLKPANIKVRTDGTVKILDFGLAKAFDTADAPSPIGAPTLTIAEGALLGTPSYMSPEQARGGAVDRRADVWAFGCVLYEMLTGRKAFDGSTSSDAIAAVLTRDPDWSAVPAELPRAIERLLHRCLEKDTKRRLRDIADAREHLEDAAAEVTSDRAGVAGTARTSRRERLWIAITGSLAFTTLAVLATRPFERETSAAPEPVRFAVLPPDGGVFATPLLTGSAYPVGGSISPDGRMLAFTASDSSGRIRLWIRPIDSTDAWVLEGTDGAALPFWSHDGKSLGYFGLRTLNRIDLADNSIQVLVTDLQRGRGGAWNRDGVILFAPALSGPLHRVQTSGGRAREVTTLRAGQRSHRFPYFLPDGRHFLYYAEGDGPDDTGVFVGEFDAKTDRRLFAADTAAVYAQSGHLLFVRQGTLLAQPFDAKTLQMVGDPVSLATSVPMEGASPAFSVSNAGVLTYRSGITEEQQFAWFDRAGKLLGTVGPPGHYRGVDLSPDGRRVAVHRHDGDGGDIWVIEPRGTMTRVTSSPAFDNAHPAWSPDGSEIAFVSLRDHNWGLYRKHADVADADALLIESAEPKVPTHWLAGGLLYTNLIGSGGDTYLLPFGADIASHDGASSQSSPVATPVPVLKSAFYEGHAQVSPDGKWIAYMSPATGEPEIYVRPFPEGAGAWQVSTAGGVTPRWRADGSELFYVSSYDNGQLMAVPVRVNGDEFVPGTPQRLFGMGLITPPHSTTINVYHTYEVAPDGQRFLIPRPVSMLRGDASPTPITVVLNWTAMLGGR